MLVGRGHVLDKFCLALEGSVGDSARAMLPTGVRGAGKTVALNACEDEAYRRGWAVISETVRPGLARRGVQELREMAIIRSTIDG